jgi:hypothetical protein
MDIRMQYKLFREAQGTSCWTTCIAKAKALCEMRKRGDWEENDDQRVLEKNQKRRPAFYSFELPNKKVVGISHKSYLHR